MPNRDDSPRARPSLAGRVSFPLAAPRALARRLTTRLTASTTRCDAIARRIVDFFDGAIERDEAVRLAIAHLVHLDSANSLAPRLAPVAVAPAPALVFAASVYEPCIRVLLGERAVMLLPAATLPAGIDVLPARYVPVSGTAWRIDFLPTDILSSPSRFVRDEWALLPSIAPWESPA